MANIIREALSLLNSMVHSGENHSIQSATLYMSARRELALMDAVIQQNAELRQAKEKAEAEVEGLRKAFNWIRQQYEANYNVEFMCPLDEAIYLYAKSWYEKGKRKECDEG